MQDLIAMRPLKRRRLIPRRPHPDLECLFRREQDRFCPFPDRADCDLGLDGSDRDGEALSWIGSDSVPLSPDNLDRPGADQPATRSSTGLAGVR
jgi:hypothetical protein